MEAFGVVKGVDVKEPKTNVADATTDATSAAATSRGGGTASAFSWGGLHAFMSSIQAKSSEAITHIGRDLNEISEIVQSDMKIASKAISEQIEHLKKPGTKSNDVETLQESKKEEKTGEDIPLEQSKPSSPAPSSLAISKSLFAFGSKLESFGSQLLHGAEVILQGAPPTEPTQEATTCSIIDSTSVDVTSGRSYRLLALQEELATYTTPPKNDSTFAEWKESISLETLRTLSGDVLLLYPTVKKHFQELVPSVVDENTFWHNYLYKASMLASQEIQRDKMLEKVQIDEEKDEDLGWGVEEGLKAFSSSIPLGITLPPAPIALPVSNIASKASPPSSNGSWVKIDDQKEDASTWSSMVDENQLDAPVESMGREDVHWGEVDAQALPKNASTLTETPQAKAFIALPGEVIGGSSTQLPGEDDWGAWD